MIGNGKCLSEMIGGEVQDKLIGFVMGKAEKQMLFFQISKAINAFGNYVDETKALPEKVRVLEERQDNIEQTVRKNFQDVRKLVYDFAPVVEHVIVRTKNWYSYCLKEINVMKCFLLLKEKNGSEVAELAASGTGLSYYAKN